MTPALASPIRIVSDTHFGHPASYVDMPAQLAPLLDGIGTVVFNGDTVEMRFRGETGAGLAAAARLRAFCLDRRVEPVFLNGNHDPTVSDRDHLDLMDGRVLVMHGDALFPSLSPWSPRAGVIAAAHRQEIAALGPAPTLEQRLRAAKLAAVAVGMRKPPAARSLLMRLRNIAVELFPPRRAYLILRTWMETPRLAADFATEFRPAARVIIIGHIHAPSVRRKRGLVIINTGCYLPLLGRSCVDIADGQLKVRRVDHRADDTFAPGRELHRFDLGSG